MRSLKVLLAAVVLGAVGSLSWAADAPKDKPKDIDVVICLDTSNSMDGLIESAKNKLWDIINELAQVKPTPNLRVGLYSYGNDGYDPKVGWIRKEVDLTTDLDKISEKLFGLTTRGGTEYVTRVCRDALNQQKWSEDKDALKLIFVCGNEPASQDPEVKLGDAADLAKKNGVIVNPIYCGNANDKDARDWKEYATLCDGKFISISQEKGTVAIATPMDKELIDLSAKLNTTYLGYGKQKDEKKANQEAQDANAGKASGSAGISAQAARAQSKGGALYRNSDWDLVDKLKEDPKFDIKKVPDEELCDELRKLKPDEREKYVKDKLAERENIQKQIAELSTKRAAFLKDELKKNPSKGDKAFDEAVRGAIREQAKGKGIKIDE